MESYQQKALEAIFEKHGSFDVLCRYKYINIWYASMLDHLLQNLPVTHEEIISTHLELCKVYLRASEQMCSRPETVGQGAEVFCLGNHGT